MCAYLYTTALFWTLGEVMLLKLRKISWRVGSLTFGKWQLKTSTLNYDFQTAKAYVNTS
jgi:hypothetical protein